MRVCEVFVSCVFISFLNIIIKMSFHVAVHRDGRFTHCIKTLAEDGQIDL